MPACNQCPLTSMVTHSSKTCGRADEERHEMEQEQSFR